MPTTLSMLKNPIRNASAMQTTHSQTIPTLAIHIYLLSLDPCLVPSLLSAYTPATYPQTRNPQTKNLPSFCVSLGAIYTCLALLSRPRSGPPLSSPRLFPMLAVPSSRLLRESRWSSDPLLLLEPRGRFRPSPRGDGMCCD